MAARTGGRESQRAALHARLRGTPRELLVDDRGAGIALGAAFGTLTVLLLDVDPRWELGVGLGSLLGLFLGLLAAILDTAIGG